MNTKFQKQKAEELKVLLNEEDQIVFQEIHDYLIDLEYRPQKQKLSNGMSLIYKMKNKTIAKIGKLINREEAFYKFKFNGCEIQNEKFIDSIKIEIEKTNMQYCTIINTYPDGEESSNNCGRCRALCTGGGLGYYIKLANGTEILRCGAYVVKIIDFNLNDISWIKECIDEQHKFNLSLIEQENVL